VTVVFDRCNNDTEAVVDAALDESRRRGHSWLGTEHVLLALAQRRDLLTPDVAALLPDPDSIAAALDAELGEACRPEADLLQVVGIDLEAVRSAVRRTFGDSALERLGRRRAHQPWQPWRRPTRRCMSILAGSRSMAPRLKKAFDLARREADRQAVATIDPALLLLGIVEVEDALANHLLRGLGVNREQLRQALRFGLP
jgi:ATP-dependent Clp protease ATP-binding subunit ClpA